MIVVGSADRRQQPHRRRRAARCARSTRAPARCAGRWDPIPQDSHGPRLRARGAARSARAHRRRERVVGDRRRPRARSRVRPHRQRRAPTTTAASGSATTATRTPIVALRASTGEVVWHFQTVHHDLWDYDNASPPALVTHARRTARVPVVLQATKTGQLFVLDRETGEPLFPVEERPVPASDVPGEQACADAAVHYRAAAAQPAARSAPTTRGATTPDRAACREQHARRCATRASFTPPSLRGHARATRRTSAARTGAASRSIPARQIAVVPVNRIAGERAAHSPMRRSTATPREAESNRAGSGDEYTRMQGTPYVMRRAVHPRRRRAAVHAAAVRRARRDRPRDGHEPVGRAARHPLGGMLPRDAADVAAPLGSLNLGGAIVTAGGVVFIGGDAAIGAARVRRRDGARAVVGRAAGGRQGDADDVSRAGATGDNTSSSPRVATAGCSGRATRSWRSGSGRLSGTNLRGDRPVSIGVAPTGNRAWNAHVVVGGSSSTTVVRPNQGRST